MAESRPWLRLDEALLPAYVVDLGLVPCADDVRIESGGWGNINWVRRVRSTSSGDSWIVKQARPALERFPEYSVTTDRICFERKYIEVTKALGTNSLCPRLVRFDELNRVLVLEDLGDAERLDVALARCRELKPTVGELATFLGTVHAATAGDRALAAGFENSEMQRLHGDHIFALPFHRNDFPLAPAVHARAEQLWADKRLLAVADATYERYLGTRRALVHADVQPTNILISATGAKLLDAEIAHFGDPAFDVGTFIAHLLLAGVIGDRWAPMVDLVGSFWRRYSAAVDSVAGNAAGSETGLRATFLDSVRYSGFEMARRTIGAARVPGVDDSSIALALLRVAYSLMLAPIPTPEELVALGGSAGVAKVMS